MKVETLDKLIEESKKVIEEKNPPLQSVVFASLLASLEKLGILTQGTVGALSNYFTPKLIAYFLAKRVIDPNKSIEENLNAMFKEFGFDGDSVVMERDDDKIKIKVKTGKCRICPKQVGGAMIKGFACPVPYIVATILTYLTREEWKPVPMRIGGRVQLLKREGEYCTMEVALSRDSPH